MCSTNKTLPKLTVDIFDRPDCPECAKWAAVDECGDAYVYDTKPVKQSEDWHTDEGGDFIGEYDPADWQNSLIERPAKNGSTSAHDDVSAPVYDDVKSPSYYVNTPFGMELKKITCHYDFNCGSALKYIIRHGKKIYGGMTGKESAIKDLGKAIESLQNEIEYIRANWEELEK